MQQFAKQCVFGAVLALGLVAIVAAAPAPDPAMGTWTLNVTKSKFDPGPPPKSQTRTYTETADGITLSMAGVAADGTPTSLHATYKTDGKDYPITGSPNYDTLSVRRINRSRIRATQKREGKVVATTIRSVSAHGKVLTLTSDGTDIKGGKFHDIAVFDKQ
jgi:hypothetical protein